MLTDLTNRSNEHTHPSANVNVAAVSLSGATVQMVANRIANGKEQEAKLEDKIRKFQHFLNGKVLR